MPSIAIHSTKHRSQSIKIRWLRRTWTFGWTRFHANDKGMSLTHPKSADDGSYENELCDRFRTPALCASSGAYVQVQSVDPWSPDSVYISHRWMVNYTSGLVCFRHTFGGITANRYSWTPSGKRCMNDHERSKTRRRQKERDDSAVEHTPVATSPQ